MNYLCLCCCFICQKIFGDFSSTQNCLRIFLGNWQCVHLSLWKTCERAEKKNCQWKNESKNQRPQKLKNRLDECSKKYQIASYFLRYWFFKILFCKFDLDVAKYTQWFTTEYPQNSGERLGLIESAVMNDSSIWTWPYRLYIYVDNFVVFWGQNKVSFHCKENFNKRSLD